MKLFSSIFKLTILVLATVSISRIAFAADPAGVILKVSDVSVCETNRGT